MLLKPLKRVSVPDADTFEMIEPSAGTATAFIGKLKEFPQIDEGHVSGTYFSGLRILICLYENGKPYLSQLVNSFHAADPETWPRLGQAAGRRANGERQFRQGLAGRFQGRGGAASDHPAPAGQAGQGVHRGLRRALPGQGQLLAAAIGSMPGRPAGFGDADRR